MNGPVVRRGVRSPAGVTISGPSAGHWQDQVSSPGVLTQEQCISPDPQGGGWPLRAAVALFQERSRKKAQQS